MTLRLVLFFVASQLVWVQAQCNGESGVDGLFDDCLFVEEVNHENGDLLSAVKPLDKGAGDDGGVVSDEEDNPKARGDEGVAKKQNEADVGNDEEVVSEVIAVEETPKTRKLRKAYGKGSSRDRIRKLSYKKRRGHPMYYKSKRSKTEDDDALVKVQEILSKLPLEERILLLGLKKRRKSGSRGIRKQMYMDDANYINSHDDGGYDNNNYDDMMGRPPMKQRPMRPSRLVLDTFDGEAGIPQRNKNVNININSRKKKGSYGRSGT